MNAPPNEHDREDPDLRYAEYVLGTLDADARGAVASEVASHGEAAAVVERWERRLSPLAELVPEAAPPTDVWTRILSATQGPAAIEPARRRWSSNLSLWRRIGIGAGALAAALVVFVLLRTTAVHPAYLASTIQQSNGSTGWTATLDVQRAQLIVVPATPMALPQARAPELWVIPPGSKPIPLGMIASGEPITLIVDTASLRQLRPTAKLAVSIEPLGGSSTGQPTGPVIGIGAIREVTSPRSPT